VLSPPLFEKQKARVYILYTYYMSYIRKVWTFHTTIRHFTNNHHKLYIRPSQFDKLWERTLQTTMNAWTNDHENFYFCHNPPLHLSNIYYTCNIYLTNVKVGCDKSKSSHGRLSMRSWLFVKSSLIVCQTVMVECKVCDGCL